MNNNPTVRTCVIMTVDIETSGPSILRNGILSIGICVGTHKGVLEKKRIDIKLSDDRVYDQQCMQQFWHYHPTLHQNIQKDAVVPHIGMQAFVNFICKYESRYHVKIVTDNPSFDVYFINYYLEKYTNSLPLTYTLDGKYRPIYDIKSAAKAVLGHKHFKNIQKYMTKNYPSIQRDHYPDNDAEYLYYTYRYITSISLKN